MESQILTYFVVSDKTVFMPLRALYPECYFLRKDNPRTKPLQCFYTNCPNNKNCGEVLAKRVYFFLEKVEPNAEGILAYFKHNDRPQSIFGCSFFRDMQNPKVSLYNPYAFRGFQKQGVIKQWVCAPEFVNCTGMDVPRVLPILSDVVAP